MLFQVPEEAYACLLHQETVTFFVRALVQPIFSQWPGSGDRRKCSTVTQMRQQQSTYSGLSILSDQLETRLFQQAWLVLEPQLTLKAPCQQEWTPLGHVMNDSGVSVSNLQEELALCKCYKGIIGYKSSTLKGVLHIKPKLNVLLLNVWECGHSVSQQIFVEQLLFTRLTLGTKTFGYFFFFTEDT